MSTSKRFLAIGSIAAVVALCASAPARAEMVAGWDFSQYIGDGTLAIDENFTFVGTLDANYSNLVTPEQTVMGLGGFGPASAAYGTMFIDGQFGSTAVGPLGSGQEQFVPTSVPGSGSLLSNLDAPIQDFGDVGFEALPELQIEGQTFAVALGMVAFEPANVVFRANRGAPPVGGSNWKVSFAGQTQTGTSSVGVDFSTTGSGYASVGTVNLTTTDTRYELDLGPADGATAFVRLRFQPEAVDLPVIDNVAISVPEPAAAASGLAALIGLLAVRAGRRR